MPRRTLADVHREEGRREGIIEGILANRKQILLEQLCLRYKELSPEIEQAIRATQDADQLAEWLRRFATAKDLDSIGIVPPR